MNTITLDSNDGVALLTLNRPQVLNCINQELIAETREAIAAFSADPAMRVLLLTGAGRAFCSGADLAAQDDQGMPGSVGERVAYGMRRGFNPLVQELAAVPKPVVAAVNGVAAGGGVGMALSADIVVAARSAYFVQVFGPRLGIVPDMGCTWFLQQHLGRARARALALTGDRLSAQQAADWGLIWRCVGDDELMDVARGLALRLAKGPTNAFAAIKRALDAAEHNTLAEQLNYELDCQRVLCDHSNFLEGVGAFLQKREPEFSPE